MTSCPLLGSYLSLPPSSESIMLVPYKLSYKLTHLALAAFKVYLAFIIGTTSWGPAIWVISLSTLEVSILKSGPSFFK